MIPETSLSKPLTHPAWRVWDNPIFRRYCCSRLRPKGLGVSLLITVLIAGFMVAMAYSTGVSMAQRAAATLSADPTAVIDLEALTTKHLVTAARSALMPMLILQGVILFVFGTAQVAGGMTAERDEGVIDYQRLIPMSPLSKVIGYVFGLPVREYVIFLTTLPFAAWLFWKGDVKPTVWLQLYTALFSSTLLYHFTGLLTGTVVKNRRWAFLASIGLVFCLYTVIPQLAKFGLVFFKYLTITPVVQECLPDMLPEEMAGPLRLFRRFVPVVKFFGLDFSELVFTLFSQLALVLTFVIMLCRRWRRAESHLLGKLWATGFYIWIQILLLGNALPLVESGDLFPSRALRNGIMRVAGGPMEPQPMEAVVMSGVYGLFTLLLIFLLGGIITPTPENQVKGWRRARKKGRTSLPFLSDAATSFWFVIVMAIAGASGWFLFTRGVVESPWFPGHFVPLRIFGYFVLVMLTCGLSFQLLLEAWGGRVVALMAIFVGVVPIMVGAVLIPVGDSMYPAVAWLLSISPLSTPIYAALSQLSLAELPVEIARAVPAAFTFWLVVGALVMTWLVYRLFSTRRAMAKEVLSGGAGELEAGN
jgi:hypothetical protein